MRLFVVTEAVDRCFESGEALVMQELDIELGFPDDVVEFVAPLAFAKNSRIYYLPMAFLEALARKLELHPSELEDVIIDDEELEIFLASVEGSVPWAQLQEHARQMESLPQASFLAAKAKPQSSETWELTGGAGAWIEDLGEGQAGLSYIYLLLDSESEVILSTKISTSTVTAQDLLELIYQAVVYPMGDSSEQSSRRPARIRVSELGLMELLYEPLQSLGVGLTLAPTTVADEAFASMLSHMGIDRANMFFSHYDEAEVRAFINTADAFYALKPWERLSGTKYLAFRLDAGDWRYANVMGQEGEAFGLAMFYDWLELCRFVHNRPTPFYSILGEDSQRQLRAAGGAESLLLQDLAFLHPQDIVYLQGLGFHREAYPVAMRFSPEGMERPRMSLLEYGILLKGMQEVLASRHADKISSIKKTFSFAGHVLELRYPAKGDEALAHVAAYRLSIAAKPIKKGHKLPGIKKHLELEASGLVTLYKLSRAIHEALGGLYISGFGFGLEKQEASDDPIWAMLEEFTETMGTLLWANRSGSYQGPHLHLAQLEGLKDVWIEQWDSYYSVKLERLEGAVRPLGDIVITKG